MNISDNLEDNWKMDIKFVGILKFLNGNLFFLDSISFLGLCYRKVNGFLVRLKN